MSSSCFSTLVLICPPQIGLVNGFPQALVSLANYVSSKLQLARVQILDLSPVPTGELQSEIENCFRDAGGRLLVGITCTTSSYQSALEVACLCKLVSPNCKIVLGGHHASAQDKVILRHHPDIIDFVIRGEGEIPLLTLLQSYPKLDSVPSLTFLLNGEIYQTPPGRRLSPQELDEISPIFEHDGIRSAPGKLGCVTYVSARGCPLSCSFCSVANDQIRAKSISQIISDLRNIISWTGADKIAIEDNFFAHSEKRTIALCEALAYLQQEPGISFRWDCQTRVESVRSPHVLAALVRAGCEGIYLGIESLVPRHIEYLGKSPDPDYYLRLIEQTVMPRILEFPLEVYFLIQLGLPFEDERDVAIMLHNMEVIGKKTRAKNKTLTLFPMLHVVYPGTRHYWDAVAEKRFGPLGENVFEEFTKWEASQAPVLTWLGEHFAHGTGGIPEGILDINALRSGKFQIDERRIDHMNLYLELLDDLPGISLFRYGSLLTQPLSIQ